MDYENPFYPFDTYREWKDVEDIKNLKVPFGAKVSYFADQHPILLAAVGVVAIAGIAGSMLFGKAEEQVQAKAIAQDKIDSQNENSYYALWYVLFSEKTMKLEPVKDPVILERNQEIMEEMMKFEKDICKHSTLTIEHFKLMMEYVFNPLTQEWADEIITEYKVRNGIA